MNFASNLCQIDTAVLSAQVFSVATASCFDRLMASKTVDAVEIRILVCELDFARQGLTLQKDPQ